MSDVQVSDKSVREGWDTGIESEVSFWDKWFETKGMTWQSDYASRVNPDLPLSDYHRSFIDHLPEKVVKVLDVGAGPLTELGKKHPFKDLIIVATDALAPQYDRIMEKYGVTPLVRTMEAHAERLTDAFPENWFDMVNARNCIDHTYDPMQAILQMLRVVKGGCSVVLNHAENEAETENYEGLHQWNFTMENGDFIIKSRTTAVNVTHEVKPFGVVDFCGKPDGRWLRVHIRKHAATGYRPFGTAAQIG